MQKTGVVVLNWNGKDSVVECLDSLQSQSSKSEIIVIDNGSVDGSLGLIKEKYPDIELIVNPVNVGFAAGVNQGISKAIELGLDYVALFNNDAVADKKWLENLVNCLGSQTEVGIATCKFISLDKSFIDSTGDLYTIWGLPYPRGRKEAVSDSYDDLVDIFGASGGASLYRVSMLKEIGLFDKDFFAYYEDIDISFRAQLAGWKVKYVPSAIAYHQIGATSSKIKGFTTYQTTKNLPWIIVKDVPFGLWFKILPRFSLAYISFIASAVARKQGWFAFKGLFVSLFLLPKKLLERRKIQSTRKSTTSYIDSIIVHDLPPNATKLRHLRSIWWKFTFKNK